jgi:phosphoribosylformimino-5-aminoimidazole carboxamide ribotide isomerase
VGAATIAAGDAARLADEYVEQFGLSELYVADLDAILGGATQDVLIRTLTQRLPALVDAAVTTADQANRVRALGADAIVVGLETLATFDALNDIVHEVGGKRVVFSLDLRNGTPVRVALARGRGASPCALAAQAVAAGAHSLLVLDLARVGTGTGVDYALVSRIRQELPQVVLLAGGGLKNIDDVKRLADLGCDAVLVASALHSGSLTAGDVRSLRSRPTRIALGMAASHQSRRLPSTSSESP